MRYLETDTGTNVDIHAATAIGAYTANADRLIIVDVMIDAVAGNGDYVMYVTKQIGGAGSAYIILPKTTMTAAAGETAISGQSCMIAVRSGDILTVYVDGLAGDTTTPDYITRWFEFAALKPATADRALDVDADGKVLLQPSQPGVTIPTVTTVTNAPTGMALEATLAGVKAKTDLITTGTSITIASQVVGSTITVPRGDTLSAVLTNIGELTNCSKLWFTVKDDESDTDATSLIQIEKTAGLLYINGTAASVSANGSITINDEPTGDVTVMLAAVELAKLSPGQYHYDIQILRSTGIAVSTLTNGTFIISADYTRAVA